MGAKTTSTLGVKRAHFQTLPVSKSKRLASAGRRLVSGPPDRLLQWDLRHGAPSSGDSGHFIYEKQGGETTSTLGVTRAHFFKICRSLKVRDSRQQAED